MAEPATKGEYRSGHVPRTLRVALGCFATGVTVVTALDGEGRPAGLTVNSFTSVSLEPPLLLVNAHQQQPASITFSTRGEDRFGCTPWSTGEAGAPILGDSLCVFECERFAVYDGGDHHILVGQVVKASFDAGLDPLRFFRGRYRRRHFD